MKYSYEYLLTDGSRDEISVADEPDFREFLKAHKKEIDSMTVTLDDGRKFTYERKRGWEELDTPF